MQKASIPFRERMLAFIPHLLIVFAKVSNKVFIIKFFSDFFRISVTELVGHDFDRLCDRRKV